MSFYTSQVTVADSATLLAAVRRGRRKIKVVNLGTTAVYLGNSAVATTTGVLLTGAVGAEREIETNEAVYAVVASGTQAVSIVEVC